MADPNLTDRLIEALTRGARQGWRPQEPIGIGPESTKTLTDAGVFGVGPLKQLNEAVARPAMAAADVLLQRVPAAAVHGWAAYQAQLAHELGINKLAGFSEPGTLERGLGGMADTSMLLGMAAPAPTGWPRAARAAEPPPVIAAPRLGSAEIAPARSVEPAAALAPDGALTPAPTGASVQPMARDVTARDLATGRPLSQAPLGDLPTRTDKLIKSFVENLRDRTDVDRGYQTGGKEQISDYWNQFKIMSKRYMDIDLVSNSMDLKSIEYKNLLKTLIPKMSLNDRIDFQFAWERAFEKDWENLQFFKKYAATVEDFEKLENGRVTRGTDVSFGNDHLDNYFSNFKDVLSKHVDIGLAKDKLIANHSEYLNIIMQRATPEERASIWKDGVNAFGKVEWDDLVKAASTSEPRLRDVQTRDPATGRPMATEPPAGGYEAATGKLEGALAERLRARAGPPPVWRSGLQDVVEQAPIWRGTGQQWLGTLQNKAGVTADELQWTGLRDYLTQNADKPLTKDDVVKAMRPVKLQDTVLSDKVKIKSIELLREQHKTDFELLEKEGFTPELSPDGAALAFFDGNDIVDAGEIRSFQRQGDVSAEVAAAATRIDRAFLNVEDAGSVPAQRARFSEYTLPGGENYREHLIHLSDRALIKDKQFAEGPVTLDSSNIYRSPHFSQPNVVAHFRTTDRQLPDGSKALFVEEIQSDWHQAGREKGYRKEALRPLTTVDKRRYDELARLEMNERVRQGVQEEYANLIDRQTLAERTNDEFVGAVPDAPFKSSWPDLALKRAIRTAVDEGKDAVAWTTGKQQADRYDLEYHVKKLIWDPVRAELTGDTGFYKGPTSQFQERNVHTREDLIKYVGNELADKLIANSKIPTYDVYNSKGNKVTHKWFTDKEEAEQAISSKNHIVKENDIHRGIVDNLDMYIGGEGMKAFYDKMLPAAANKLAKKYGGKVEQQQLDVSDTGTYHKNKEGFEPQQTVHVLRLTPELKKAAREGFKMMSTAGTAVGAGAALGNGEDDDSGD